MLKDSGTWKMARDLGFNGGGVIGSRGQARARASIPCVLEFIHKKAVRTQGF